MNTITGKTVILVNGVPASGKSSVAREIANRFQLPYLTLDEVKEPFMAMLAPVDRATNRQLGKAAYAAIWSAVAQAPLRCVYVIDAWFGFQPLTLLQEHLRQAGVSNVLEVWNQIDGERVAARYKARIPQRPAGHPGEEYLPELRALANRATPLGLGPLWQCDQNYPLDYPALFKWLEAQLTLSQPANARVRRQAANQAAG